jgi:hypothetical protein
MLSLTQRLQALHGLTSISLSFTNSDSMPLNSKTPFTALSVLLFGIGLPETPRILILIYLRPLLSGKNHIYRINFIAYSNFRHHDMLFVFTASNEIIPISRLTQ